MTLWRISNHSTLDGRGGLYAPARWHDEGRPIVYLAESPAGALIEILVHLEVRDGTFPPNYQLLKIDVPDPVSREILTAPDLAVAWEQDPRISRVAGTKWLLSAATALLSVPSALVPETNNWLLNPLHPDSRHIAILWGRKYPYDRRLFRR